MVIFTSVDGSLISINPRHVLYCYPSGNELEDRVRICFQGGAIFTVLGNLNDVSLSLAKAL